MWALHKPHTETEGEKSRALEGESYSRLIEGPSPADRGGSSSECRGGGGGGRGLEKEGLCFLMAGYCL